MTSEGSGAYTWPYARSPGGSTPSPDVTPKEGGHELWTFFWLALLNSTIIAVAGLAAWLIIHH